MSVSAVGGVGFLVLVLLVQNLWMASYTREEPWIPVLVTCLPMGFLAGQVEMFLGK